MKLIQSQTQVIHMNIQLMVQTDLIKQYLQQQFSKITFGIKTKELMVIEDIHLFLCVSRLMQDSFWIKLP